MSKPESLKKTGLYFGSFNPIHYGHLILASHIEANSDLDQVWFVVSPQNPLKNQSSLLDNRSRFAMVQLAIKDNDRFLASDIEFSLPMPSYTINTLVYLSEKFPKREFILILGEDNLDSFDKWKNYNAILDYYKLYVYPRKRDKEVGEESIHLTKFKDHRNVTMIEAPQIEISASHIRQNIRQGKTIRYLVPEKVRQEIERCGYYR